MDMSKVNMHKRMAMTGNAPDVPAKAGHFRGGGIAKRGKGKAMQEGGALVAQMAKQGVGQALQLQEGGVFRDTVGRALGRRTPDAEGRALPRPKKGRGIGKSPRGKKGRSQGYKAREDESLGMRRGKESGKKQSMRDRRDESYGKWGSRPNQRISKQRGGRVNTRRENILEEKGRVDAEKAYTKGGKERLGAEQRRLAHELGKKEGGFLARRKKLAGFGAVRIAAKLHKKSKKRKK